MEHSEVIGRAKNFRMVLGNVWTSLRDPLLAASSEEEVTKAFESYAQPYAHYFVPRLALDALHVIREKKFPTRPKAQINFLADSLAGRPNVGFRTSRDVCSAERAKERAKSPHEVIRHEFYIECTCGYKGPAKDNACRKCKAPIMFSLEELNTFQIF